MNTPKLNKLTLILTLLGALGGSALNVFAQNLTVTSNTTVSGTHYENNGTNYAALTNSNTWTFTGTNVTLTGTADSGNSNGRDGARFTRGGTLNLFSSTVSANHYGIYLENLSTANLTDSHVSTTGDLNNSSAIHFGTGTNWLTMNGGSIEAFGTSGRGIGMAQNVFSVLDLQDVAITTHGNNGTGVYGFYHYFGSFTMIGGSITTYGDNAIAIWGIGGNSIYTLQDVAIHTSGANASGIVAMFGFNYQVSGGSITTEGDGSHGIYFNGGPMNGTFDGITITTTGSGADGVRMVASATLALTNSELRTAGEDSSAFTVNDLSALTLNNTAVTVESAAPLLQVGGDGADLAATVTVNGGTLTGAGGGDLLHFTGTAAGTGSVTFNHADTAAAGGIAALDDTVSDNTVNVNGGTGLRGNVTNSGSGALTVNLNDSTLAGDLANLGDGTLTVTLDHRATGSGGVNGGNLHIADSDSSWTFGQDSALDDLANHGTLHIGDYQVVVENANHTGTLNLNVNSDSGQGGSITVTGTASGTGKVHVDAAGNGSMKPDDALKDKVTGDGTEYWVWDPISWGLETVVKDGNNPDGSPHFRWDGNSVAGSILNSSIALQQAMWFAQQNSLLKRMGELRYGARASCPPAGGTPAFHIIENIWLRSYGQQLNVGSKVAGQAYEQLIYGVDLGTDHKFTLSADSDLYLGVFAGYGRSDIDYRTPNTDGELNSYYGGLYATWLHSSGFYIDATVKAASIDNDLKAPYDNTQLTASYSDVNLGGSIEIGRKFTFQDGWFVEPQFQVNYLHILAENYTAGPMTISAQDFDALQFRIGSLFGRTINLTNSGALQPYVKISGVETISSGGAIHNGYQHTRANTDGARAELGAGLIWQLDTTNQLHLDYEASFGDKYDKPWGLTAGYRHQF